MKTASDALIFAGTSGPRDADIAFVGEAYGSNEEREGKPFVGQSGELLSQILGELGIDRTQAFLTNMINARPPGNDILQFFNFTQDARARFLQPIRGLYPKPNVIAGVEKLAIQLRTVQPKIVVGFGNYPLWALTEGNFSIADKLRRKIPTGITSWRGSQLYCREDMGGFPLMPTYHPAGIMRNWPWYYTLRHDLGMRMPKVDDDWSEPPQEFTIRPSFEVTIGVLEQLIHMADGRPDGFRIAADLETRNGHIACCALAWSASNAISIPFMCTENDEGYWAEEQEFIIIKLLRKLFLHPHVQLVGQNFLYDAQYFALYWAVIVPCYLDTMIAQHLCWPGTPKGLDYLSSLYCEHHVYWKDEGKYWEKNIPEEQLWTYNCKDAIKTWEISWVLEVLADKLGLSAQLAIQMRQFPMVLDMMIRGVRIDTKVRAETSMDLAEVIEKYEQRLPRMMPSDVVPPVGPNAKPWYRSPIQQAEIFYDVLGISELKNRKTKRRTMNDEALQRIARIEPILEPIIVAMEEYRSLGVFQNNFCRARLDPDNRMRSSFAIAGTETFRFTSSKNAFGGGTNMQNIPPGTEVEDG